MRQAAWIVLLSIVACSKKEAPDDEYQCVTGSKPVCDRQNEKRRALCDATRDGAACFAAGRAIEKGYASDAGEAAAARDFERACDLGNADGCAAFATWIGSSANPARDRPRAKVLFEKACDLGSESACSHLSSCYHGLATLTDSPACPKDLARAKDYALRACKIRRNTTINCSEAESIESKIAAEKR